MLTYHSAPPDSPVLAGKLEVARRGPSRRPTLLLSFWDPTARARRSLDLPDEFRADGVASAALDRPLSPGTSAEVLVTPDPDAIEESRRAVAHFRARLQAWRREIMLAGRLAGRNGPGPAI